MKRLPKTFWRLLATLALALALMACASGPPGYEETSQSWQEEVQLQDGRVIVVERTEYYSAYCGPGIRCGFGKRGRRSRSKIEFESDGRRIVWEQMMQPMILQLDRHSPVVVARLATGDQRSYYVMKEGGDPATRYVAFRYDNGAWKQIPLKDAHVRPEANLLVNSQGFGSWTSLERQKELNASRGLSEWQRRIPKN